MRAASRADSVRTVQRFATGLLADPGCPQGHTNAWRRVVQAALFEELLVGLGYCAGYAQSVSAMSSPESSSWQLASCLANAAKTFAALLRSPVSLDVAPCVRVYRSELRSLLEIVAQEITPEATGTA